MPLSPYLRRIRRLVGHELLVLPSVAVLPWDRAGRLLLVRAAETGLWQTIGGAVEPDESPRQAAVREAQEEAGVLVQIDRIRDVVGGPQFRLVYPNGDIVSYVSTIVDARVVGGQLRPDRDETLDVRWFAHEQLSSLALTAFTHALFEAVSLSCASQPVANERPPSVRQVGRASDKANA